MLRDVSLMAGPVIITILALVVSLASRGLVLTMMPSVRIGIAVRSRLVSTTVVTVHVIVATMIVTDNTSV